MSHFEYFPVSLGTDTLTAFEKNIFDDGFIHAIGTALLDEDICKQSNKDKGNCNCYDIFNRGKCKQTLDHIPVKHGGNMGKPPKNSKKDNSLDQQRDN